MYVNNNNNHSNNNIQSNNNNDHIEAFKKLHPLEYYKKFLDNNIRPPNGRDIKSFRNTIVMKGLLLLSL